MNKEKSFEKERSKKENFEQKDKFWIRENFLIIDIDNNCFFKFDKTLTISKK